MTRALRTAVLAAFFGVWTCALLIEATVTPVIAKDEPLWLMRSLVSPADFSDARAEWWAEDIPALNRWCHWAVLKLTGLDHIPAGERRPWWKYGDLFYFVDRPAMAQPMTPMTLEQWEAVYGTYAPERQVWCMRYTNILIFMIGIFALYAAGKYLLRSWWKPMLAIAPYALSPLYALNLSFVSWSGEIELFATCSLLLLAWCRYDVGQAALGLKGGREPAAPAAPDLPGGAGDLSRAGRILFVVAAVMCGLAVSSKHNGVLMVLALMGYLAWRERGRARLWKPLLAAAIALAVFVSVNVVFIKEGPLEWPRLCLDIVTRRADVIAERLARKGPMEWTTVLNRFVPYTAVIPLTVFLTIKGLSRPGLRVVAIWGVTLWLGTALAVLQMRMPDARYFGPLELGLWYATVTLAIAGWQKRDNT